MYFSERERDRERQKLSSEVCTPFYSIEFLLLRILFHTISYRIPCKMLARFFPKHNINGKWNEEWVENIRCMH